jgi:ribose transport system ATP-binding protein
MTGTVKVGVSAVEPSTAVLEVRGLTKRYPGVVALDEVAMTVRNHEVVGLVGQNGSGKSTLLKVLAGLVKPTTGTVFLRGREVQLRNAAEARSAGIGMVFQEQSLIPNLTVAENIFLGVEGRSMPRGWLRWGDLNRRAQQQLDKIGLQVRPTDTAEDLSMGQRQMVELAKALVTEEITNEEPVLLFDEATSVLSRDEVAVLLEQINRLRSHAAIVFVSHRLDEVLAVADRAYVLKDGRRVAERTKGSWDVEEFFQLMVGREAGHDYYQLASQSSFGGAAIRFEWSDLTRVGTYRGVSGAVHAGEVLGICGVESSGRASLMRTLFGAEAPDQGTMRLGGREVRFSSPKAAVEAGVGYIPADRTLEAVFPDLSVEGNITIGRLSQWAVGPVRRAGREAAEARTWVKRLAIKTPTPETPLSSLSGGNQQKVVFARLMLPPSPSVLLLDHPTRGLDVGAKEEVYRIIRDFAASGTAIVLISDSLEETIALSHNLVVMRDGEVTASFPAPANAKPEPLTVLEHML